MLTELPVGQEEDSEAPGASQGKRGRLCQRLGCLGRYLRGESGMHKGQRGTKKGASLGWTSR